MKKLKLYVSAEGDTRCTYPKLEPAENGFVMSWTESKKQKAEELTLTTDMVKLNLKYSAWKKRIKFCLSLLSSVKSVALK